MNVNEIVLLGIIYLDTILFFSILIYSNKFSTGLEYSVTIKEYSHLIWIILAYRNKFKVEYSLEIS